MALPVIQNEVALFVRTFQGALFTDANMKRLKEKIQVLLDSGAATKMAEAR
jgi:hypothetical protein